MEYATLSSYSRFTSYMSVCMMKQRPLRGSAAHPYTGHTHPGIVAASATIQGASAGAGESQVSVPRAAYPRADADWRSRTDSRRGGVPPRLVSFGVVYKYGCTGMRHCTRKTCLYGRSRQVQRLLTFSLGRSRLFGLYLRLKIECLMEPTMEEVLAAISSKLSSAFTTKPKAYGGGLVPPKGCDVGIQYASGREPEQHPTHDRSPPTQCCPGQH